MADTLTAYCEEFVTDDEHPAGLYAFACNICDRSVDDGPCPDHAPTDIPGLRLVDCAAEPRHLLWVVDREDYGVPCFLCIAQEKWDLDRLAQQCRHWPWRHWRLTGRLASWASALGVISGYGIHYGQGHLGCRTFPNSLRGRRPYVLWVQRETWRCLLKGRHRRLDVGGLCGRCAPWPCCGSTAVDHLPSCRDTNPTPNER